MPFEGEHSLHLTFFENPLGKGVPKRRQPKRPGHIKRQVAEFVPEGEDGFD